MLKLSCDADTDKKQTSGYYGLDLTRKQISRTLVLMTEWGDHEKRENARF